MAGRQVLCAECGRDLTDPEGPSEGERAPCPTCGSLRRNISIAVTGVVAATGALGNVTVTATGLVIPGDPDLRAVLRQLSRMRAGTAMQLASMLHMSPDHSSAALRLSEEYGFVRQTPGSGDGWTSVYSLTEAGVRAARGLESGMPQRER
jgi:hypothetical protein